MDVDVIAKEDNPMLHRTDVRFEVTHEEATPSRLSVRDSLAAMLNKDATEVVVHELDTKFGMRTTVGYAKVYETPEHAQDVEQDYMLRRNKIGENGEAVETVDEDDEATETVEDEAEDEADDEAAGEADDGAAEDETDDDAAESDADDEADQEEAEAEEEEEPEGDESEAEGGEEVADEDAEEAESEAEPEEGDADEEEA